MGEADKNTITENGNEDRQPIGENETIISNNTTKERRNKSASRTDTTNGGNTDSYTELKPPTAKRGRPKGSHNKTKNATFVLQDEEINSVSGSSAGLDDSSNNAKYKHTRKKIDKFMTSDEAQSSASFILGIANDLATQIMGDDAGMNLLEGSLLSISLPQYLATLEISTIEKTKSIAYPVMLLGGVSMWGLRLLAIANEKRKENNKDKQKQEQIYNDQQTVNNTPEQNIKREGEEINWTEKQFNPKKVVIPF